MNAINFGSGWWPTIRKREGLSGYGTMAAGLREHFESEGPWEPRELVALDPTAVAAVLGQDPYHPLMEQFAEALRDVGSQLLEDHGGRYLGVVAAAPSISELAGTFAGWHSFADVSQYEGREVPFFKRAQIAARCDLGPAEIDSALWNRGRGRRYKALPRPRSRNTAY
jgi:putative queuosine salvage protein